jgi:hypothetical protein
MVTSKDHTSYCSSSRIMFHRRGSMNCLSFQNTWVQPRFFHDVLVALALVSWVMFCRSYFLSFVSFFICPLCCHGSSWSWSYGSWMHSYLCNQCLSPLKVVSSNLVHGEMYSIQHYVIKFVSDLRQVGGFLRILGFPLRPLRYSWNIVKSGVKYLKPNNQANHCVLCPLIYGFWLLLWYLKLLLDHDTPKEKCVQQLHKGKYMKCNNKKTFKYNDNYFTWQYHVIHNSVACDSNENNILWTSDLKNEDKTTK